MNKMMLAVFDTEKAAAAGSHVLRGLHDEGDITLYAMAVIAKDMHGKVNVLQPAGTGPVGAGVGAALGGLIGLLGGPAGVVLGAVAGGVMGSLRDFRTAGVDMEFIGEAEQLLAPGKVAVVAEIEEDWVMPVDQAMEAAGAVVCRRARTGQLEAQVEHDVAGLKSELQALEAEAAQSGEQVKAQLETRMAQARLRLSQAMERANLQLAQLKREAEDKAEALQLQLAHAKGDTADKLEERGQRIRRAFQTRGAKLSQAWGLTKDALAG
ncbi:DUF1269 domain-containing protein [Ideonella sp.]|uniref:DUF1269 domain-containing protein n=1 Tax=Ideonella sp. TaxID=1929293 RepID=UPI003BB61C2E